MAFNGSGLFERIHNWVTDRDGSVPITASRMDAEQDGIATGLSTCITKDGQTTITANLPMATFKHTGVGAAAARTDYADAASVQDGSFNYVVDSGAADAYVMTLSPAITSYATGVPYIFKAVNANTGASTLNINAVGAKSILKYNDQALAANDIEAGSICAVVYDGTSMQLISSVATSLDSADIGVTVQGYDADTAKLDVIQTFTAAQTLSSGVDLTMSGGGSIDGAALGANTAITTLDTSGNVVVGGTLDVTGELDLTAGVSFDSGTNVLAAFVEDDFTVGISFGGGVTGITYAVQAGHYQRTGNQVTITGQVVLTSKGTDTGEARLTGLPIAVASGVKNYSAGSIRITNISFADSAQIYAEHGTSTALFTETTNAGTASNMTDADFANNSTVIFELTYFV